MKERPILFKGPLVRAILDGTKTQTRRLIKDVPTWADQAGVTDFTPEGHVSLRGYHPEHGPAEKFIKLPCRVGEQLWVREAFCYLFDGDEYDQDDDGTRTVLYRADNNDVVARDGNGLRYRKDGSEASPWIPSIHMPRNASRIDLEITEVRVQRLWDITDDDARAEGIQKMEHIADDQRIPGPGFDRCRLGDQPYRFSFALAWEDIYGEEMWDSNPWVWAISFRRVRP